VRAKVIDDATHVAEHAVHVDKGGHFATREQPEVFERTVDNVVERRARSASITRSRSTATTACGAPLLITSGLRSTSRTRRGGFGTTTSGEGKYAMTEMVIQQILLDAGARHRTRRGHPVTIRQLRHQRVTSDSPRADR
jgi:hypothetical protein